MTFTKRAIVLMAAAFAPCATAGSGSTCEAPYYLASNANVYGNSCTATQVPLLNHGTIRVGGSVDIFAIPANRDPGRYQGVTVVAADPQSYQPAVFVCEGTCGTDGECRAADAAPYGGDGVALIALPNDNKPYYLIVGSLYGTCGDYQLHVQGHLDSPSE